MTLANIAPVNMVYRNVPPPQPLLQHQYGHPMPTFFPAPGCPQCGCMGHHHPQVAQTPPAPRAPPSRQALICRDFNKPSSCPAGPACLFAHVLLRCAFFNTKPGCRNGDDCGFQHDATGSMPTPGEFKGQTRHTVFTMCPNENCTNTCLGKQCKECHTRMRAKQSKSK